MAEASNLSHVTADDLTKLRWPTNPELHPEGRELAFLVSALDSDADKMVNRIHVLREGVDELISIEPTGDHGPARYTPNGERLGYTKQDQVSRTLISFVDRTLTASGTIRVPGVNVDFQWAPTADRIAGTSRMGDSSIVWVADIENDRTSQLFSFQNGISVLPTWSPTREQIAFLHSHPPTRGKGGQSHIWLTSPDGSATKLLMWNGPIHAMAFSPDGNALAITGHPTSWGMWQNRELWVVPISANPKPIQLGKSLDRSITQIVRGDDGRGIESPGLHWTPTGNSLVALVAEHGISSPLEFTLDGSVAKVVEDGRCHLELAVARSTGELATSWAGPNNPGDASVYRHGAEIARTDLNSHWVKDRTLAATVPIKSVANDGETIEGWLTLPQDGDTLGSIPLAIQVHGGPHYPVGHRFSFDAQRLAGQGIGVLRINPRGSQGYGARFARGIVGDWGGPDFGDIISMLDTAIHEFGVDEARIAIFGESYGGWMTNLAITRTRRFAAAVSENSISDTAQLANGPAGPSFWHLEFGGPPADKPDLYERTSPLMSLNSIDTPLLMIHAEGDTTCPIAQSEAMVGELRRLDKPARLHRIPEEGHWLNVYGKPSSRSSRINALDAFLCEHLNNQRETEQPSRPRDLY